MTSIKVDSRKEIPRRWDEATLNHVTKTTSLPPFEDPFSLFQIISSSLLPIPLTQSFHSRSSKSSYELDPVGIPNC